MQATPLDSMLNRLRAEAEAQQLPARHDTVLPLGKLPDLTRARLVF